MTYSIASIFTILVISFNAAFGQEVNSLFKSDSGKIAVIDLYDFKLESLNVDYNYRSVRTRYGETNIIICGDSTKPPLFLMHGSNGSAPIALETYPNLIDSFQVFAVDLLGQPNKSEGTVLNMSDDSYGKWVCELFDSLKVNDVTMVGFSLGGLAILKTLEYNESRVKKVFLSAPAYIVSGNPLKALFHVFLPMKKYMKTRETKYVQKFLTAVFTAPDPFALDYLSIVLLEFNMDFTPVPVIDKKVAQEIKTPIILFGADEDILFPGKKMIKRAKKIFPSVEMCVLLDDSKHVQSTTQNRRVERVILNIQ